MKLLEAQENSDAKKTPSQSAKEESEREERVRKKTESP